jgi:hypothetical protein
MAVHPPKPSLALSIGVVGHRLNRIPEQARLEVMVRIRDVLKQLSNAADAALEHHQAFFADHCATVTLVSGLAEGADRMAAQAAIEQDLALTAIVPFTVDSYEQDFEEQSSRAEYRELTRKATKVLALCGDRKRKPRAYEIAGLTLIDNSDIILAIWDGRTSAGRGGTTELIECAARSGLPIIHIDATDKHPPRVLWGGLEKFPLSGLGLADLPVLPLADSLPSVVDSLVRPPPEIMKVPERKGCKPIHLLVRLFLGKREPATLTDYFKERQKKWNLRLEYPLLLGLLGIRVPRRNDILSSSSEPASAEFARLTCGQDAVRNSKPARPIMRAAEAYGWADTLGIRYAQKYRSAYVCNFVLTALALVAAVAPFAFDWPGELVFVLGLACGTLIYINTFAGNVRNWHRRWMEAREVAERLRAAVPAWLLGQTPGKQLIGDPSWVDWYVRANYRAMGVCPGSLDLQRLSAIRTALIGLIDKQAHYHAASAALMNAIDRRLFIISTTLAVIVILLTIAWKDIELFAIVGLAALTAAIYGIRATGDFEGRAERSEHAAATLIDLRDALQSDTASLSKLRARAQTVYEMITGEIAQWWYATQSRPLAIPG